MTQAGATVDLRSDTVTKPTPGMREAIASAEVGDDVFADDPTINRLQATVADLLGKESALFMPSGTMANQVAIKLHTSPGDGVLFGWHAHTLASEAGAAGLISGVQHSVVPGDGRFTGQGVRECYLPDDHKSTRSRLVMVENTHNAGGGLVWAREALDEVLAAARDLGLVTHLDGARIWNASVACGESPCELAKGFDTVSVCLSKGLGAPAGSVLAGTREAMHEAHRLRKMLGGGMRQVGLLAAAGLYALDHHRDRLVEDHQNAQFLAEAIAGIEGLSVAQAEVATNILMVEVDEHLGDAKSFCARARDKGLLFATTGPRQFRLVTHLDVDRAACQRAVGLLAELASSR